MCALDRHGIIEMQAEIRLAVAIAVGEDVGVGGGLLEAQLAGMACEIVAGGKTMELVCAAIADGNNWPKRNCQNRNRCLLYFQLRAVLPMTSTVMSRSS